MANAANPVDVVSKNANQPSTSATTAPREAKKKPGLKRTNLGPLKLEQELTTFGRWVDEPIWVPPKDSSTEIAKTMLGNFGPFASKEKCWAGITKVHRSEFTQVREFELPKASIRLPKGRIFVTVTEQKDFDKIKDPIPVSVQMRLDEFLERKGNRRGIKVYYLKPLCVESENQLIFTTRPQIDAAIAKIQEEVFGEYKSMYLADRIQRFATGMINAGLAVPRRLWQSHLNRKRREIEEFHKKLEFERRRRALMAAQEHEKLRTTKCTFDEMLALSDSPSRESVIDHYVAERELSEMSRQHFLIASAITLPWFAALSVGISNLIATTLTTGVTIAVCDPAFVVEMPGSKGELLKIGHFDEVDGVMHVEI